ncbi:hypothetical protein LguiB_034311 [Lonicera macranthoides]
MALEKAFLLILTFTLLLSYSIEALPAPSPEGNGATQAPSPSLDGPEFENRRKMIADKAAIADKVNKAIPTAEEILQKTKKRMDETPGSSPAEQCLKSCMGTYQTIIDTIKENVDNPSSDATLRNDLKILALQDELEKCSLCNAEVVKEDPEIKKYNEWFGNVMDEILKDYSKIDS